MAPDDVCKGSAHRRASLAHIPVLLRLDILLTVLILYVSPATGSGNVINYMSLVSEYGTDIACV